MQIFMLASQNERFRWICGICRSTKQDLRDDGWRISDSIDSNIHVADQVDRVYIGGDTIQRIRQLTEEQLWDRTCTVDNHRGAERDARGNSDTQQLKRIWFNADVEFTQTDSWYRHGRHAAVVGRQTGSAGARPWTVDDLEPISTESAEAYRISIMPGFDKKKHVNR